MTLSQLDCQTVKLTIQSDLTRPETVTRILDHTKPWPAITTVTSKYQLSLWKKSNYHAIRNSVLFFGSTEMCSLWPPGRDWSPREENGARDALRRQLLSVLRIVEFCAALYTTVLYCTVLYSTVLYSAVLNSTALYTTVLYSAVLYSAVLYCTHCPVMYSTEV